MSKFAKLFDTAQGQFLATLSGVDDDDNPTMTFRVEFEPCIIEVTHVYLAEETRNAQFEQIDQAKAEEAAAGMVRMGRGLFEEDQS